MVQVFAASRDATRAHGAASGRVSGTTRPAEAGAPIFAVVLLATAVATWAAGGGWRA